MNRQQAVRYLVAAGDNPKLAAWISILNEHKLGTDADISPSDHWEAYEGFYNHGLVSSRDYNEADVRREFLQSPRPNSFDVQQALDNWKILNAQDLPGENTMTKVYRDAPSALVPRRQQDSFDSLTLAPMQQDERSLSFPAPEPTPMALEPAMPPQIAPSMGPAIPLGMGEPLDRPKRLPGQELSFEPLITCGFCKTTFMGEVSEGDEADEQKLRDAVLVFYMYHGTCPQCGHESHHSTEGPAPYGIF